MGVNRPAMFGGCALLIRPTALIAESDPKAKDLMVRLTMNLIAEAADPAHDQ